MDSLQIWSLFMLLFLARLFLVIKSTYHDISPWIATAWYHVPILFTGITAGLGLYSSMATHTEEPQIGYVDGDIAGAGTRISLYLTLSYLLLQCLFGYFTKQTIGNRDVPGGLYLLNLCLSFAMCLQGLNGKLSFGDAAIGSMVLDAQSTALLGTLGLRDALKARTYVFAVYLSAVFSLILICIFMSTVSRKTRAATVFKVMC
jgi:uncharacterized membrane protein YhdT